MHRPHAPYHLIQMRSGGQACWAPWQLGYHNACLHTLDESSTACLVPCPGNWESCCKQARTWGDWSHQTARAMNAYERWRVFDTLFSAWGKVPSQRLGQLLSNALLTTPTGGHATNNRQVAECLWYIEDFDLAALVTAVSDRSAGADCETGGRPGLSDADKQRLLSLGITEAFGPEATDPVVPACKYAIKDSWGNYYAGKRGWTRELKNAMLFWGYGLAKPEHVPVYVRPDGTLSLSAGEGHRPAAESLRVEAVTK